MLELGHLLTRSGLTYPEVYYYYFSPPSNEPVAQTLPATLIMLFTKFWTTLSMTHTFGKYCK